MFDFNNGEFLCNFDDCQLNHSVFSLVQRKKNEKAEIKKGNIQKEKYKKSSLNGEYNWDDFRGTRQGASKLIKLV